MSSEAAWVCAKCHGDWIFDRNETINTFTATGAIHNPTGREIEFDDEGRPVNAASESPDLVCGNCLAEIDRPIHL